MIKYLLPLIYFLLGFSSNTKVLAQTTNILVKVELENPKDKSGVLTYCKGRRFDDLECDEQCQSLALNHIRKAPHVKQVGSCWEIRIPAKSKVTITMEMRCLNRGFKYPTTVIPTTGEFPDTNSLNKGQESTWAGVKKQLKKMSEEEDVEGVFTGINENCSNNVREAIIDMFKEYGITTLEPNFNVESVTNESSCRNYRKASKRILRIKEKISNKYIILSGIRINPRKNGKTITIRAKISAELKDHEAIASTIE